MKHIIQQVLKEELGKHQNHWRIVKEWDVTKFHIKLWKVQGLTPYLINDKDDQIQLEEITNPSQMSVKDMTVRVVYLLTPEEVEKFNLIGEKIEKIIDSHKKQIQLMKELFKARLHEVIAKSDFVPKTPETQAGTDSQEN